MSTPKQLNGTNREDVENFNSPMENQLLDHSMEVTDHSADGDGGKKIPCTPAIQRLHNTLRQFNVHSPSDAIMSPCSQKLSDASRVRKGHQAHNQLQEQEKQKQKYGNQPKSLPIVDFDANDTMECEIEEEVK